MHLSTTDQAAVAMMLSNTSEQEKQTKLDSLVNESAVCHGQQCPDCASSAVSDNGLRGVDLTQLAAEASFDHQYWH